MKLFRPALGACGAALVAVSCVSHPPAAVAPTPVGSFLRNVSEVGADVEMNGPAILELDGEPTEVELKSKKEGDDLVVTVLLHGAESDREVYTTLDGVFCLKQAAGEVYEPPIPLLRFPMHAGDSWPWEGALGTEDQNALATAKVTTDPAKVAVQGGNVAAVRTHVDLQIKLPSASARRELVFWFVKGRGIIQREFGDVSKRRPKTE